MICIFHLSVVALAFAKADSSLRYTSTLLATKKQTLVLASYEVI